MATLGIVALATACGFRAESAWARPAAVSFRVVAIAVLLGLVPAARWLGILLQGSTPLAVAVGYLYFTPNVAAYFAHQRAAPEQAAPTARGTAASERAPLEERVARLEGAVKDEESRAPGS